MFVPSLVSCGQLGYIIILFSSYLFSGHSLILEITLSVHFFSPPILVVSDDVPYLVQQILRDILTGMILLTKNAFSSNAVA